MPKALVITAAGTNCDRELARAFDLAGAQPEPVHLNLLLERPELMDGFQLIGLPGGFSYGDAVAAGRIAAQLMRQRLYPALRRAVARGAPIIAPCNGFQIAVQMGLLPGPAIGEAWPPRPAPATVSLGPNACGRFLDRWVEVEYPARSRCVWTLGLQPGPEAALLPIAHAEGRFIAASPDLLARLEESGQVALRYGAGDNPNGSQGGIAGICDQSGLVFGLMPHPERFTRWTHHPRWTRLDPGALRGDPPGLAMFRNAVAHARSALGAAC
jgi:phosphoribosylformylglycinamidine synthase